MKRAYFLVVSLLLIFSSLGFSIDRNNIKYVIKEAENQSLLQDRISACSIIYKATKKSSGTKAKTLQEKLSYFSKLFYTDKGFQSFLLGKEFYSKEKYQEAADKFLEADQVEKSNTEVLHYLTLSYLWMRKPRVASEINTRALQVNPMDDDLIKDKLAAEIENEDWKEALLSPTDNSAFVLSMRGLAQFKLGKTDDAKKSLEQSLSKDKQYPENYYWLSEIETDQAKKAVLVSKYNELCKGKHEAFNERDVNACSRAK